MLAKKASSWTGRRIPGFALSFSEAERKGFYALAESALVSGILTNGPLVRRFEDELANYLGEEPERVVAVSSGTAALEIALRVLNVGGAVIVPTNTFYATIHAIHAVGCVPLYADLDPKTLGISSDEILKLLEESDTSSVKGFVGGVIVMHTGGYVSPAMDEIRSMCLTMNLPLIEDAAHAMGGGLWDRSPEKKEQPGHGIFHHAGTWGRAGCFSLYPTKTLTSGEGGFIRFRDKDDADLARLYRDQGRLDAKSVDVGYHGYAWRMSELHAALGLVHLSSLDRRLEHRRRIARIYDSYLEEYEHDADTGWPMVHQPGATAKPSWYKYIIYPPPGLDLTDFPLAGPVYNRLCHDMPIEDADHGEFKNADWFSRAHRCLPIHDQMTENDAVRIGEALNERMEAAGYE